jgi:hypothetical protein
VLDLLAAEGLRLPDHAQHCPEPDLPVQVDFYYVRDGVPGVCVFVDGSAHAAPSQADHDRQLRGALRDRGYRVIDSSASRTLNRSSPSIPTSFVNPTDPYGRLVGEPSSLGPSRVPQIGVDDEVAADRSTSAVESANQQHVLQHFPRSVASDASVHHRHLVSPTSATRPDAF